MPHLRDCYNLLTEPADGSSYNSATSILGVKREPHVAVTSVASTQPKKMTTWRATWMRIGPLSGLFGLVLGVTGTIASFAILYASNGTATEAWTYQPSTYLALVTAVANQAIRYAAFQGAVVSWWRKALSGTTLASLHHDWALAAAPWKALFSRRTVNWMLLPCLASVLVAIDGPLLQRASTVLSAPIQNVPVNIEFAMSPEVPRGYSGYYQYSHIPQPWEVVTGVSSNYALITNMSHIEQGWANSTPLSGFTKGCNGRCQARVRAPALGTISCTESTYESDFLGLSPLENFRKVSVDPPMSNIAFMVNIGLLVKEQELINLTVAYSDISPKDCKGKITARTCLLHSAVGLYDITIDNDVVTLDSPGNPEILVPSNNSLAMTGSVWPTAGMEGYNRSTLAGIAGFGYNRYESFALYFTPHPSPSKKQQNVQAFYDSNVWFATTLQAPSNLSDGNLYSACLSYADPSDIIRAGLNDLLFRIGVDAARQNFSAIEETLDPGFANTQYVSGTQGGSHNVYHTNFYYFLGAALLEVFCMGMIVPLYWGWWRLGRAISFSPLEIAKALGAPLLTNAHSNSTGKQIAEQLGDTPVRYGLMESTGDNGGNTHHMESQIGFAESHLVRELKHGSRLET